MGRSDNRFWHGLGQTYGMVTLLALLWPLLWAWILLDWLVLHPYRQFDNTTDNTYNVLLDVFQVLGWLSPLQAIWTHRQRGWHWSAWVYLMAFGLFVTLWWIS